MTLEDEIRQHMAESEENRMALWDRIATLYAELDKVRAELAAALAALEKVKP